MPLIPSGRIRSPSRQVRTSIRPARALGVERRQVRARRARPARVELGAHLPVRRSAPCPGSRERDRLGRARRRPAVRKRTQPASQSATRPPPSSTSPPSGSPARRAISAARARPSATGRPAARSASARRASRRRPGSKPPARRPRSPRRRRRRRRRRAPRARPARAAAASSASSARVSAMLRSRAGLISRSTGSTSARIRLRANVGSSLVSSSANGQAGGCGELATRCALERQQRADHPAAARRQPEQRPRSRARLRAGRAASRRGRCGCGRWRSGRRRCDRAAARRRRSGAPRAAAWRLPASGARGRSTWRSMRSAAQSRRQAASSSSASGAKAVVDVQGVHRLGPELARQRRRGAGGVGTARDHDHGRRCSRRAARWRATDAGELGERLILAHAGDLTRAEADSAGRRPAPRRPPSLNRSSGSRARATNSSTGSGKPLSSTRPIGSNSRYAEVADRVERPPWSPSPRRRARGRRRGG